MKKLLIAAWAVAGLLLPSIGRAECVRIPGTTQQIFERYPVVFVADVLGIDAVIDPIPFRYRVRFQVAESFKGADRGERVLDFASSPDDHVFKVGTRLLVYASRSGDRHSTACTPTRAVSNDDREVQELRKLVSGAQRP